MQYVENYLNIRKTVLEGYYCPGQIKSGETSLGEFLKWKGEHSKGVTSIREPPLIHYICNWDDKTYWFSIPAEELFVEEKERYDRIMGINDQ